MKQIIVLLGAVLLLSSVASAQTRPATTTTSRSALVQLPAGRANVTIPLVKARYWVLARVRINGQDAGWFDIDTATDGILVDKELAERLKLREVASSAVTGAAGPSLEKMVEFDELTVGDVKVRRHLANTTGSADFEIGDMGIRPSGTLGMDFLSRQPFTLDLRAGELTLYDPASFAAPKGAKEFPARCAKTGKPAVWGKVNGVEALMVIDTGQARDVAVHYPFTDRHSEVTDGLRMVPISIPGSTGPKPGFALRLPRVEAMGHQWTEAWACGDRMPDMTSAGRSCDASLGGNLLRDLRVTVDWEAGRLWAEEQPPEPLDAVLARVGKVDERGLGGSTALLRAVWERRADAVAAMLKQGADPNVGDETAETPLIVAAQTRQPDVAKLLLAAGAKPNAHRNYRSETALFLAAVDGSRDIVELLLVAGADANDPRLDGTTPLIAATLSDDEAIVRALLKAGAKVNGPAKDGATPLMFAAQCDGRTAKVLLDSRADPTQTDDQGYNALMGAALHDRSAVVRMLLAAGVKPDTADRAARTALMGSAVHGDLETMRLLLAAGADPKKKSLEGATALDYAAMAGQIGAVRLLLYGE